MLNAATTINQQRNSSVNFRLEHKVYYINESEKTKIIGSVIKNVISPMVHKELGPQVGGIQYFGFYERLNGQLAFISEWTEVKRQAIILDGLITPLSRSSYLEIK